MSFFDRVMGRAADLGVSDSDLARMAGVTRQRVYQWRQNQSIPLKYGRALGKGLASPVTYLLYGEGDAPTVKRLGQVDQGVLTGVLAAMFEAFHCEDAPDPSKAARVAAILYEDAVLSTGTVDELKFRELIELLK